MRILVVYASTEGHVRDLCRFVARCLTADGHNVTVCDAASVAAHFHPRDYDASLLAASLHVGRYQTALVRFARAHHQVLNAMPSAFLSISLAAAATDAKDRQGLEKCVNRFKRKTMWMPKAVHHTVGAFRYSRYGPVKRLIMKMIARRHGQPTDSSRDYDLTDYADLETFVRNFARGLAESRS